MFLSFPSLNEDPFRITPDPRYLYLSEQHARAKSYLEATDFLTDGFVVITGEIGCGKTILISNFIAGLSADVVAIRIHQTQITATQFLQSFLVGLGLETFTRKKAKLLSRANRELLRNHAEGKRAVLILDEAQHLDLPVMEEVRLLTGIETGGRRILNVVMAGQPALKEKLLSRELEQLRQRTSFQIHLTALDRSGTEAYVRHRLAVAGDAAGSVFLPGTFDLIHRWTSGVPRLINVLCSTAMLCAYAEKIPTVSVSPDMIRIALRELQWTEKQAQNGEQRLRVPAESIASDSHFAVRHRQAELERVIEERDATIGRLLSHLEERALEIESLREETKRLRVDRRFAAANDDLPGQETPSTRVSAPQLPAESGKEARSDSRRAALSDRDEPAEADCPAAEVGSLVPLDGATSRHVVRIGTLRIGSSADNDLRLKSDFVSRHHAELVSSHTVLILSDLNSTNGTYVNSRRISRHALHNGDLITIGNQRFKYVANFETSGQSVTVGKSRVVP